MTKQSEIIGDSKYIACLDHGFVGLKDHMGNDAAIVQAARVSYGNGTKTVREDRGLIRYLLRHHHTTPFEMCETKFHVRAPIIVIRQWARHRTASTNEESARYSEMADEFYMPEPANIKPQSKDNKQGREGVIDPTSTEGVQWLMNAAYDHSYDVYKTLLGQRPINEFGNQEIIYDPYDGLLTNEFPGIAREIARSVMPLGSYSEFYWKCNIWNLMHFLHLRLDPHAQLEIRVFAEAMYKLVQPLFPNAIEAFDDYVRGAYALSRMERELLKALLQETTPSRLVSNGIEMFGGMGGFAMEWGMSKREMEEFLKEFEIMPKPTSIT